MVALGAPAVHSWPLLRQPGRSLCVDTGAFHVCIRVCLWWAPVLWRRCRVSRFFHDARLTPRPPTVLLKHPHWATRDKYRQLFLSMFQGKIYFSLMNVGLSWIRWHLLCSILVQYLCVYYEESISQRHTRSTSCITSHCINISIQNWGRCLIMSTISHCVWNKWSHSHDTVVWEYVAAPSASVCVCRSPDEECTFRTNLPTDPLAGKLHSTSGLFSFFAFRISLYPPLAEHTSAPSHTCNISVCPSRLL